MCTRVKKNHILLNFNIHTQVRKHLYSFVYMYVRECMHVYILYIYNQLFLSA